MAAEASEKGVSGEEEKNTIAQIWKLWFKMPQLCNFVKVAKFCHFCMVWFGPEGSKSIIINLNSSKVGIELLGQLKKTKT